MKCGKAAVSAWIIAIACCAYAEEESTLAKVALPEKIMRFRSGITNHVSQVVSNRVVSARCYKPTGELVGQVIDGNGMWSTYHENGTNNVVCTYVDGSKHGRMTAWREDGTKKYERDYKSGRRDGVWIEYFSNGKKRSEVVYQNDRELRKTVWDKDGKKRLDIDYTRDKQ
jgi:antitoxin component YwqK of YwqJK toxin-antitoxin module